MANAKRAPHRARAKAETDRTNDRSDPAQGRGRLAKAVDDLTDLMKATRRLPRRPGGDSPA